MSTRTNLTILIATALTLPILAQETPISAPNTQVDAPLAVASVTDSVAASVSRDKDTLSVDFPDEDIKTILRNVADLFELNLVVPDTLTGKTSIKLRDVTWRQIFQVVLGPVGYTYIEEGNIIKIVSNELLQQEPVATEVFVINNAKADDLKPTISGLIDVASGGKIEVNQRANALIITERPSRMGNIRTIIEKLDKATDQVMIEAKFVEVTDRDIRAIGVNWASLQGMSIGVRGMNSSFNRSRGSTSSDGSTSGSGSSGASSSSSATSSDSGSSSGTTTGSTGGDTVTYVTGFNDPIPSTTNLANGAVTPSITTVPSTTFMSGTAPTFTASTTYNGGTTNGVNNGTTGSTSNSLSNSLNSTANNVVNQLLGLTSTGSTSRVASAVFSSSDFNIVISALKTQNNTKIVSNPTIVTLNNTEAVMNIGQEFPIPSYTYNAERGTFEVSGFTYKPIGIILKVTPQVNAQGVIKLSLEPEVSQQNGETSFGGAGGASIPIVATRKVKTQVSLKDGYTMGIGGLITNSKNHGGTKVPVLGSIPMLGRLFSSKSVNDSITNLLIFITAKSVTSDGASPEEVFDPRAVQAVDMSRDDLPGYRAPKGTDLFARPPAETK